MTTSLPDRLRGCFEERRFADLAELYAEGALFELHVGVDHDQRKGRDGVVSRYAEDFAVPATVLRWEPRPAPWGWVVEAEAVQGEGPNRLRFRWVHLLTVEEGRITTDTVYCTGGTPAP